MVTGAIDTDAAEFFELMAREGVATIGASYSGGGDEGYIDNVYIYDAENNAMGSASEQSFGAKGGERADLAKLALDWIDLVMDQTVDGYENNEGGGGEIFIDIAKGCARFDHYYYGEPEAVPQPFRLCVNVDTGEETIEDLSEPDKDAAEQMSLRRKAAAWEVISAALDDHARHRCTGTELIKISRQLQQDVREGSNGTAKEQGVR